VLACEIGRSATGADLTNIINYVILLNEFFDNSILVETIRQQRWLTLNHVTTITFDKMEKVWLLREDSMHISRKRLVHTCMCKTFLRCLKWRTRGWIFLHCEKDALNYTKLFFKRYCRSNAYKIICKRDSFFSLKTLLTKPTAFYSGVKRENSQYKSLDDNLYSTCPVVVLLPQLASIHRTDQVLNRNFFQEMMRRIF
jgi:hypothetical protein